MSIISKPIYLIYIVYNLFKSIMIRHGYIRTFVPTNNNNNIVYIVHACVYVIIIIITIMYTLYDVGHFVRIAHRRRHPVTPHRPIIVPPVRGRPISPPRRRV